MDDNQMLLVSIIVPVYNVEQYLRECLDSIISQTYRNIEIILVDDGSPDGSPAICDEYAAKDARIKVIHKKNGGSSSARNAGLEMAKGDYITFCDSDDVLDSRTIENYLNLKEKYNALVVGCESVFYLNGIESIIPHYHKNEDITIFSSEDYIRGFFNSTTDCSVCNKLFDRALIGSNRFIVGRTNEDLLFLYDVIRKCDIIVHSNEGHYKYRVNDKSITHTFNVNSLNVVYNALELYDKVLVDLPALKKDVLKYLILQSYNITRSIFIYRNQKIPLYNKTLKDINEIFYSNFIFIVFSSNIGFIKKCKIYITAIRISILSTFVKI